MMEDETLIIIRTVPVGLYLVPRPDVASSVTTSYVSNLLLVSVLNTEPRTWKLTSSLHYTYTSSQRIGFRKFAII